jgi:hypothetical protein
MAGDPRQNLRPVTMYGVRIIFRNFKGKPTEYNREGVRTFGVILPEEVVEAMANDGWNVKRLRPSEEEQEQGIEQGPAWLPVEAAYDKGRPPKIVLVTSGGKTLLDEDTVAELDGVDIAVDEQTGESKVDLIVNPHFWTTKANPNGGVKAYLKSMYITADEDELDRKYANVGRSGQVPHTEE